MILFVNNLPSKVKEKELERLFYNYGRVSETKIIRDKDTGLNKGFAFVRMPFNSEAAKAIDELNGHTFKNHMLCVKETTKSY